ncbi:MAG: hypothetical protein JJU34_06960 [Lunatimonas sp.]|uniref:hypothetical protein n=1 Tax=Lunatimonas sp. TaxID=2060141 RepID=UPI00263B05B5|nr:hypothetical protein [Lunatimonas sp.]MCC5937003.1 hypothetical protein [Lunatimonas sp.]
MFYHQVFGLRCASDVELPAFLASDSGETDFEVKIVSQLPEFSNAPTVVKPFSSYNDKEFRYQVPDTATYFVREGKQIWICPATEDWSSILLFFYSNAIAAMLFQRNLIPFHVSGVLDGDGVWLLSAPSRTGKSTTALKLKERGYPVFTDDTALVFMENGRCMATPSYPMIRAWRGTLENQESYDEASAFQIRAEVEKFGIHFHEQFQASAKPVKGIIYLQEQGDEITINPIKPSVGMQHLGNNVYRRQWILGMNKQLTQFKLITSIAKNIPFWMACRPKGKKTFGEFSEAIDLQIISQYGK